MLIVFRVVCSAGVVGLRHHNGTSPAPPLDTHNLRLSMMLHDGWAGHQEEDMEASGQTDSHMTPPPCVHSRTDVAWTINPSKCKISGVQSATPPHPKQTALRHKLVSGGS